MSFFLMEKYIDEYKLEKRFHRHMGELRQRYFNMDLNSQYYVNSYEDDMDMYDLYCQNKTNEVYSEREGENNEDL